MSQTHDLSIKHPPAPEENLRIDENRGQKPIEKREEKRRALGRGLESLLPSIHGSASLSGIPSGQPSAKAAGQPLELSLDRIDRNPFQTRTSFDEAKLAELSQSIAATGVVQPIVVRQTDEGHYQLITGERRLRASKLAGKLTIPAIVRLVSDEQAMEITIVENLQRADLNPIEQARAYLKLSTDFKMTQEQMAIRTGKERATVANFLRLLRLPAEIQTKVEAGELSFGHARALLSLGSPEKIVAATQRVIALAMSVRQAENYIQGLINPESKPRRAEKQLPTQDPNVHEAQTRLQRSLGLRVHIEDRGGRGRVIIEYAGLEDFDALLTALNAQATS